MPSRASASAPLSALSPDEWRAFKLVHREQLTSGANPTHLFRFALPEDSPLLGLHVASCLLTRVGITKKDGTPGWAIRPYTPISAPETRGHFDLAVKVYATPAPGRVSSQLGALREGDRMEFKGPLPKLDLEELAAQRRSVGMVAGGSGLTPMLQVAEEVLRQRLPLRLSLLFANVSEADIIARDRLDALAAAHPNFSVRYVVDAATSPDWDGEVGYVNRDMLARTMPPPAPGSIILVCGPPGMMKALSGEKLPDKSQGPVSGLLKEMGYNEDTVFKF